MSTAPTAARSETAELRGAAAPTRVAIAGFGTVGRAVARLLQEIAPPELQLVAVLNRGVERKRVDWLDPSVRWTENIDEVLTGDVDVLVELVEVDELPESERGVRGFGSSKH